MLDVILCVENRIYREGLQSLLSNNPGIGSVRNGCIHDGIPSPTAVGAREAILVDITADASRNCHDRALRAAFDAAEGRPVIALGLSHSDAHLLAAIAAGAAACVTLEDGIERLVDVLIATADGALVCPPRVVRQFQTQYLDAQIAPAETERLRRLSQREHHVLSLLEERLSNKQIARTLGLEVSTIKNHVHSIIVKLAVKNRLEAGELGRSMRAMGSAV